VQNKIVYGAFTQLEDAKAKRWVTYQAPRIPFVYGDEEGGNLYYRLTSCPLPMPADILAIRIIEALPGGVGPFSRQPFFESDYATVEERLEARDRAIAFDEAEARKLKGDTEEETEGNGDLKEHTVEELRAIADDEQIDLSGASRKDDIIRAIKRARQERGE
jgi:hypothetical protein